MESKDNRQNEREVDFSKLRCHNCGMPIDPDNHYRVQNFYYCAHNQPCSSTWGALK